jgi:hypothetical protein
MVQQQVRLDIRRRIQGGGEGARSDRCQASETQQPYHRLYRSAAYREIVIRVCGILPRACAHCRKNRDDLTLKDRNKIHFTGYSPDTGFVYPFTQTFVCTRTDPCWGRVVPRGAKSSYAVRFSGQNCSLHIGPNAGVECYIPSRDDQGR